MLTLRWRITLWYLILITASLLGFFLVAYQVLSNSLSDGIDQTLLERANHVAEAIAVIPNRPIEGISPEATDEFRSPGVYLQLFNTSGVIVARSINLGIQKLPTTPADIGRVLSGEAYFLTAEVNDENVRVYQSPLKRENSIVGAVQVGQSLTQLETTLSRLRLIFAFGTVSVVIFGLIGSWRLANQGLRPVVRVTETAREIVLAEDLSSRVEYDGPADEIGMLATTFNEMLDRLQTIFESQRRFLAEAAHELRTPLSTMLGNVDLLVRYGEDEERREASIMALKYIGQHVDRLLDDLLLLAQAEAGWHIQLGQTAIDEVFLEAYESVLSTAGSVKLHLRTFEPARVQGDADRLRQVFINVIDNAVKFTSKESTVTLDLWKEDGTVWVRVSDKGEGIARDALPQVHLPFFREPTGKRHPGAGLGLAIVHWIVEEHKGEIDIDSVPGEGTKVTISIPEYAAQQ